MAARLVARRTTPVKACVVCTPTASRPAAPTPAAENSPVVSELNDTDGMPRIERNHESRMVRSLILSDMPLRVKSSSHAVARKPINSRLVATCRYYFPGKLSGVNEINYDTYGNQLLSIQLRPATATPGDRSNRLVDLTRVQDGAPPAPELPQRVRPPVRWRSVRFEPYLD